METAKFSVRRPWKSKSCPALCPSSLRARVDPMPACFFQLFRLSIFRSRTISFRLSKLDTVLVGLRSIFFRVNFVIGVWIQPAEAVLAVTLGNVAPHLICAEILQKNDRIGDGRIRLSHD